MCLTRSLLCCVLMLSFHAAVYGQGYLVQTQALFDGAAGLLGPDEVVVAPDGQNVYAASFSSNSVSTFTRDPTTGLLTFLQEVVDGQNGVDGLEGVRAIAVSPNGSHVYAASETDASIAVFSRDINSGALSFVVAYFDGVDGNDALSGANDIVISPSGEDLYVCASDEDAITHYSRDSGTGELLSPVEYRDGTLGISGMSTPSGAVIAPDGTNIYVASVNDNAIVVLSRIVDNGTLSYIETQVDGVSGVDGLTLPVHIAISPDGENVFATSSTGDALVNFQRDDFSGELNFLEVLRDGVGGVSGLDGVRPVAVSPNGKAVITGGQNADAVAIFGRDATTGGLTQLGKVAHGFDGVEGLQTPVGIDFSADGSQVYVTSFVSNSLSVFDTGAISAITGFIRDAVSGDPLSCAAVEVANEGRTVVQTAVTDVNGYYFVAQVTEGNYEARAIAPGYVEQIVPAFPIAPGPPMTLDFDLNPAALSPAVFGHVSDVDTTAPLVGVLVTARANGGVVGTTYTCALGNYEFPPFALKGNSTTVNLRFELVNYTTVSRNVIIGKGGQQADQAMEKSVIFPATLVGIVLGETEADPVALPEARVTITGPLNQSAFTSDAGLYQFDSVLQGAYTIHASAMGYEGKTVGWSITDSGISQRNFTLVLEMEEEPPADPADINQSGSVDAVDVQLVINAALGLEVPFPTDVNASGGTDAVDIQIVINAALGVG